MTMRDDHPSVEKINPMITKTAAASSTAKPSTPTAARIAASAPWRANV